jgi:hypothetical protein
MNYPKVITYGVCPKCREEQKEVYEKPYPELCPICFDEAYPFRYRSFVCEAVFLNDYLWKYDFLGKYKIHSITPLGTDPNGEPRVLVVLERVEPEAADE